MAKLKSYIRLGGARTPVHISWLFNPSASYKNPQTMENGAGLFNSTHMILCMSENITTPRMNPSVTWPGNPFFYDSLPGQIASPGIAFNFNQAHYFFSSFERLNQENLIMCLSLVTSDISVESQLGLDTNGD